VSAWRPGRQGRQPQGQGAGQDARPATGKLLDNNKSPSRKTGELDNRGSQFYLALYWAQALAEQTDDKELAQHFARWPRTLPTTRTSSSSWLRQGKPADIGGYYEPDPEDQRGDAPEQDAERRAGGSAGVSSRRWRCSY
jgi:monomeric isocitrate dehydrogenase